MSERSHHRRTHGLGTGSAASTYGLCRGIWRRHDRGGAQVDLAPDLNLAPTPAYLRPLDAPFLLRGGWEEGLADFVRGVIADVGLRPGPRARLEPSLGPTIFRVDPFGDPEMGQPYEEDPWNPRRTLEPEGLVYVLEPGMVEWVELPPKPERPRTPKPAKFLRGLYGPHPERNEQRRTARARRRDADGGGGSQPGGR